MNKGKAQINAFLCAIYEILRGNYEGYCHLGCYDVMCNVIGRIGRYRSFVGRYCLHSGDGRGFCAEITGTINK
jgi:hypothetical protein